jgi:hypothetical protein
MTRNNYFKGTCDKSYILNRHCHPRCIWREGRQSSKIYLKGTLSQKCMWKGDYCEKRILKGYYHKNVS